MKNEKQKGKAGRPRLIGETEKAQIIKMVAIGASFEDAAAVVGASGRTLRDAFQLDEDFRHRVYQARAAGKIRLIQKIGSATQWQAAAWMLERRYGKEYGKPDRLEDQRSPGRVDVRVAFIPDSMINAKTQPDDRSIPEPTEQGPGPA